MSHAIDTNLIRYRGEGPPHALAQLRGAQKWVAWKYDLKGVRWTKLPIDPCTGRLASVSDPKTWGTFGEALACAKRNGLAGVGIVLTDDDDITGIDIDQCISDSGLYSALAAEVIEYAEAYAEVSPSGEGIRIFARGKIDRALKDDAAGVEAYGTGRYLTVTGNQIEGTPCEIRPAPRTLSRLTAAVDAVREMKHGKANGKAGTGGGDFFGNVNAAALARLDDWVRHLHPTARKYPNGAWRIASENLGRSLQEDLSYHADGIRDHGEERGLTPIDAVQRYGGAADAVEAARWLCERMAIEPASLGWTNSERERHEHNQARPVGGRGKSQAERLIEIATGEGVELYHAPDGTAYADLIVKGHRETWPLKSPGFKGWLRHEYYLKTNGAPNAEAMSTAMGVIEARAHFDGDQRPVFLRVATLDQRMYLDLCSDDWSAIEIDCDGWRLIDQPPVRFRRTPGMQPLPVPVSGGNLEDLRNHLHVDERCYEPGRRPP